MMVLRQLLRSPNSEEWRGEWWPARELPMSRLRDAWEVFRGRAEAVRWPNQESRP
jgi:hypothetical protein